jgi:hypothetical protein
MSGIFSIGERLLLAQAHEMQLDSAYHQDPCPETMKSLIEARRQVDGLLRDYLDAEIETTMPRIACKRDTLQEKGLRHS